MDVDGSSPVTFNNLANGNYVLAVRHRNHLGLRTDEVAFPKAINESKSTAFTTNVIDLRTASDAQLFGNSAAFKTATHPSLGTVNLLWGGNANSNISVRASGSGTINDYLYLINTTLGGNAALIINNVYSGADMNMDRIVRASGSGSTPAPYGINDYLYLVNIILGGNAALIITQQL